MYKVHASSAEFIPNGNDNDYKMVQLVPCCIFNAANFLTHWVNEWNQYDPECDEEPPCSMVEVGESTQKKNNQEAMLWYFFIRHWRPGQVG